jgi:hypothetical protein
MKDVFFGLFGSIIGFGILITTQDMSPSMVFLGSLFGSIIAIGSFPLAIINCKYPTTGENKPSKKKVKR